jgi:hypothetical protein
LYNNVSLKKNSTQNATEDKALPFRQLSTSLNSGSRERDSYTFGSVGRRGCSLRKHMAAGN